MTTRAVPDTDVALRLLLVEDDALYAGFIGATLMGAASARFQHDHVASIRAAVRQLSQTTYDLVLLDLGLPDVIDLEGLTTVVNLVPDVPVVILSSAEDEALALRAVKAGAGLLVERHHHRRAPRFEASGMRLSGSTPSSR